jgi:hypothetical protein
MPYVIVKALLTTSNFTSTCKDLKLPSFAAVQTLKVFKARWAGTSTGDSRGRMRRAPPENTPAPAARRRGGNAAISSAICVRTTYRASKGERELFVDNLLVRIHFIIEMIWWTGLAPWEFELKRTY